MNLAKLKSYRAKSSREKPAIANFVLSSDAQIDDDGQVIGSLTATIWTDAIDANDDEKENIADGLAENCIIYPPVKELKGEDGGLHIDFDKSRVASEYDGKDRNGEPNGQKRWQFTYVSRNPAHVKLALDTNQNAIKATENGKRSPDLPLPFPVLEESTDYRKRTVTQETDEGFPF